MLLVLVIKGKGKGLSW